MKFMLTLLLISGFFALQAQQTISLYSDVTGHNVGDILSVMILENADANRASSSQSDNSSDMQAGGTLGGDVFDLGASLSLSSKVANKFDGKEGTAQSDRLTGRMSVRIVEESAGGIFKIEGERKLSVNGEENVMKLTGYVRPRDINADNTIYSFQIADAEITYRKSGIVHRMVGQGGFTRMMAKGLGVLLVGMGTVAFTTAAQ